MKRCPYCGYSNYDNATECRNCQGSFVAAPRTLYKTYLVGAEKAREIRGKALLAIVLALLIKVYWGGHGPWPVIDFPVLLNVRPWLEPCLLYGGIVGYVVGWILHWI